MNVAKAMSIHRRRSITIDKLPDKNKVMFLYGLFWPFVHGVLLYACLCCCIVFTVRDRGQSDWFLGFIFSGLGKNNVHNTHVKNNIALSCAFTVCLSSYALSLPMAMVYGIVRQRRDVDNMLTECMFNILHFTCQTCDGQYCFRECARVAAMVW